MARALGSSASSTGTVPTDSARSSPPQTISVGVARPLMAPLTESVAICWKTSRYRSWLAMRSRASASITEPGIHGGSLITNLTNAG